MMASEKKPKQHSKRSASTGAIVYANYPENFVVWPGRETALHDFVNQTYRNQKHKLRPTKSSNSEDALTWSCFDTLNCLPDEPRSMALEDLWACAFDEGAAPDGFRSGQIFIGKKYGTHEEPTEVDASIEGDGVLVFIEAKLYSSMSLADLPNRKLHDQLARKLRVGVKAAQASSKTFYFIVLDIRRNSYALSVRVPASKMRRRSRELVSRANGRLRIGFPATKDRVEASIL